MELKEERSLVVLPLSCAGMQLRSQPTVEHEQALRRWVGMEGFIVLGRERTVWVHGLGKRESEVEGGLSIFYPM